jgi:hypothetical protein
VTVPLNVFVAFVFHGVKRLLRPPFVLQFLLDVPALLVVPVMVPPAGVALVLELVLLFNSAHVGKLPPVHLS